MTKSAVVSKCCRMEYFSIYLGYLLWFWCVWDFGLFFVWFGFSFCSPGHRFCQFRSGEISGQGGAMATLQLLAPYWQNDGYFIFIWLSDCSHLFVVSFKVLSDSEWVLLPPPSFSTWQQLCHWGQQQQHKDMTHNDMGATRATCCLKEPLEMLPPLNIPLII